MNITLPTITLPTIKNKEKLLKEKALRDSEKKAQSFTGLSDSVLNKIIETTNNTPNYNAEEIYNNYKDYYTKTAQKASENAYGLASSLTGGYGNSYASSAASAAYESYMNELSKKKKEIDDTAYERARDKITDYYNLLSAARNQEKTDYDIYRDDVSDSYKDKDLKYKKDENAKDFAFDAAKLGDYSYLNALGVDTYTAQQNDKAEKNKERLQNSINLAKLFAQYGDYSKLSDLGFDVKNINSKDMLDRAKIYAQFGDYSGLSKLGIDVSSLKQSDLLEIAAEYAKYGDYSLLEMLGVNTSSIKAQDNMDMLLKRARYYNYYK